MNQPCGLALVYNIGLSSVNTPIKINLALHVVGLLENNYHALESLVIFAPCGDKLSICSAQKDGLTILGRFAYQLAGDSNNLIIQARDKLRSTAKALGYDCCPIDFILHKTIPVACGLGGGSGDAAAAIVLLNGLWRLNFPNEKLLDIAATIGADIPACLHYLLYGRALYMRGLGDKIEPIEVMPKFFVLLVNDVSHVPTKSIFDNLENKTNQGLMPHPPFHDIRCLLTYLDHTRNDLYKSATIFHENIAIMHKAVVESGALFTTMSGSGATIVGIFNERMATMLAAAKLQNKHPDWFIKVALHTATESTAINR